MTHYLYSDQVRTLLIFFTIIVVVGNFALLSILIKKVREWIDLTTALLHAATPHPPTDE